MYDYGNARVAALRSRLLDAATLRRLEEAESPAALLVLLERFDDWRPILHELGPLTIDPRTATELAVERHRSARLGGLPPTYGPPALPLVEALVLPLDRERVLEILRRRHADEPPETVAATVDGGALLDARRLAAIARAPGAPAAVRLAGRFGLMGRTAAEALARGFERDAEWPRLEAGLVAASEAAREARAAGPGADAGLVRAVLAAERDERAEVAAELEHGGAAAAAELERTRSLARLDRLDATARRDPLGIGAVAGYVAAVEAQAIRLRAILAHVVAGWSRERTGAWLAVGRG